jgi:hypothetical protein
MFLPSIFDGSRCVAGFAALCILSRYLSELILAPVQFEVPNNPLAQNEADFYCRTNRQKADAHGARLLIAFYSRSGSVEKLANAVAEGAQETGSEVRLRRAREVADAGAVWQSHRDDSAPAGLIEPSKPKTSTAKAKTVAKLPTFIEPGRRPSAAGLPVRNSPKRRRKACPRERGSDLRSPGAR